MNAILYITIFIMGTLFGSFYTLAVYRIPRKIDIVKTHSFCPKCNHKLGFWELIPILSYIFLGGKCKHCKEKISPRYICFEIFSGIIFVLIALAIKLDVNSIDMYLAIELLFAALYITAIFIIAGIDKDNRKIEKSLLYYSLVILIAYIIYLCIIDISSIYRYVMYLAIIFALLVLDTLKLKTRAKNSYTLSILILLTIMAVFTGETAAIWSIIITYIIIAITIITKKIKNKKMHINNQEKNAISENLHIGYYLCASNIVSLIAVLFINNWIM